MSAHKNFLRTSDFIIYILALVALILEYLIPTNLGVHHNLLIICGLSLLLISWSIILLAKYQFKKHGQKSGPGNETSSLITSGLFKHSRNPIYLGVIFIVPAIGLILNSLWFVLMIVPTIFLIRQFLILPEESYLLRIFGEDYSRYCSEVRRWI